MSRYELKYQLNDYTQTVFKHICETEYGFFKKYEDRKVRSLYFDTSDNEFVMGNLSGISQRQKARLRWYITDDSFCVQPKFEIKARKNKIGLKNSFNAPVFDEFTSVTVLTRYCENIFRNQPKDIVNFNTKAFLPVIMIEYTRSYYENLDGVRVTFDKKMRCSGVNMFSNAQNLGWLNFRYNLAEVKVSEEQIEDGMSFIQRLPFKHRRHSKYMVGLHLLGSVTYI